MIGSLLSTALKVVTIPVDVLEIGADAILGGKGNRETLRDNVPTILPSDMRDALADSLEQID